MPRNYIHLTPQDRAVVMLMRDDQCSIRSIAKRLCRSASTISRELKRADAAGVYDASHAQTQALALRIKPRKVPKLHVHSMMFIVVHHLLNLRWSPQQIAGRLKSMWPNDSTETVSHETIYNAIYLHPRGERKREMIACLRHHNQVRKPRSQGADRRGQIPDRQSIHVRPPEVEDRLIPGHWEGDLIKGAGNRSSVGTLVERTSGFVVLAKMSSASAADALESFSKALEGIPEALRKTL